MKGDSTPVVMEQSLIRTKDLIQLFDQELVNDTVERISAEIQCAPFRKFGLYVSLISTSTPTTIRVKVEFLDRWSGQWYVYKQGPFAALFWEDGDTATLTNEAFVGDVLGRSIRVTLLSVGGTSTKYWKAGIAVDFWN